MWSKKPNHISPWRTCTPPGCISSWAAESSLMFFLPALLGPLHSCPADTHPREKPRGNTGMDMCFKSHLAALETPMMQPAILTCCCRAHSSPYHPFPPGKAGRLSAWSWQLWFLTSQPSHQRTCECLEEVSSLSRALCHPDINASGTTG